MTAYAYSARPLRAGRSLSPSTAWANWRLESMHSRQYSRVSAVTSAASATRPRPVELLGVGGQRVAELESDTSAASLFKPTTDLRHRRGRRLHRLLVAAEPGQQHGPTVSGFPGRHLCGSVTVGGECSSMTASASSWWPPSIRLRRSAVIVSLILTAKALGRSSRNGFGSAAIDRRPVLRLPSTSASCSRAHLSVLSHRTRPR